jgi:hypothetical protein
MTVKEDFYSSLLGPHLPVYITGSKYGANYYQFMLRVKDAFDPKGISHPPGPMVHNVFVERAKWMKPIKDWETPKGLLK